MHLPRMKHHPKYIDLGLCMNSRMRMENPWLQLQPDGPYVLEIDRASIETYHEKRKPDRRVDPSLIPQPFIGNPWSAKLVLWNLSPGLAEGDAGAHARQDFKEAMLRNLRHESQK